MKFFLLLGVCHKAFLKFGWAEKRLIRVFFFQEFLATKVLRTLPIFTKEHILVRYGRSMLLITTDVYHILLFLTRLLLLSNAEQVQSRERGTVLVDILKIQAKIVRRGWFAVRRGGEYVWTFNNPVLSLDYLGRRW